MGDIFNRTRIMCLRRRLLKVAILAELRARQEQQSDEGIKGKAKLSDLGPGGRKRDHEQHPEVTHVTNREYRRDVPMVAVSDNSATNVLIDRVGVCGSV